MVHRLNFFLFFLLFSVCLLHAQKISIKTKFRQPETRSRLSNPNIRCILQDAQEFLWVGTDDGLNRFDGYDYKVYRNDPNDSLTLMKNRIQSIFEDSQQNLWVSTVTMGLHLYDRKHDRFIRIEEFSQHGTQVMCITEDADGNLWIGGNIYDYSFIASYDRQSTEWQTHKLFSANDPVYTMIQASESEFWLGTRLNGLYSWNKNTFEYKRIGIDNDTRGLLPASDIERLLIDGEDIWIAMRGGLSRFEGRTGKFLNYKIGKGGLPIDQVLDICLDGDVLWIGTENGGLSRLDKKSGNFSTYAYDKYDPNSVVGNSIWSLHRDRQGRLWVGSYAKGLCLLDPYDMKFREIELPFSSDLINAIVEDSKGRFWIGTEDGVILIENRKVKHFRHNPLDAKSLSNKAINCILEDSKGQIWFGIWNGGINRYDEQTGGFIRYLPDHSRAGSLENPNVFYIMEHSQSGELYVCTFGGLYVLKDQDKGLFAHYVDLSLESNQLLLTAFEDSRHRIWIGSYTGFSRFDPEVGKFEHFHLTNDTSNSVDRVNCILEDRRGRLWIGSSIGLHQRLDDGSFVTFQMADGLPVDYVQGILEDRNGNLWLGTTNGLVYFNPDAGLFKTYNQNDGLSSNEFRRQAFFSNKDGKLYVGASGLNVFDPDSIPVNLNPPAVYLTDLRIFNQSVLSGDIDGILEHSFKETSSITLHYKSALLFSIHYVGVNLTSSFKNKYAYMLEGFDKNWNEVGDQRFATFTNLDPGKYTFRVRAANSDGIWSGTGTTLNIHILPPLWKTAWFRTLIIVMVLALIIGVYYVRIRSVNARNLRLAMIVEERTSELQTKNIQIDQSRQEIMAQNDILLQKQDEIAAQRDLLARQNSELEIARQTIEKKNREITSHNLNLEFDVKKRTSELVTQNIQLQQFAFITAHNLRAPVARILGLGQLLQYPASEEDEKIILNRIIQNTVELDEVVKDLNKILDIQYNTTKIWIMVDLAEELQNILTSLHREIVETGTVVNADLSQGSKVYSIKSYIHSILLNLISNAIKYRHPARNPVIQIRSAVINEELIIQFCDNGVGINMEKYGQQVFKLYKRFHTHVEGKGMGLYMVKTQIEALGGSIEINGKEGEGVKFTIRLPLRKSVDEET